MILWHNCLVKAPISQVALETVLFLTMLFIVLLLVAALAQNNDEGKLKITSLESDVTKNPSFLAVKVSFLILVEYVELPNHAETYFCFFLAPFLRMTTSALMLLKTKTNSLPCAQKRKMSIGSTDKNIA